MVKVSYYDGVADMTSVEFAQAKGASGRTVTASLSFLTIILKQ